MSEHNLKTSAGGRGYIADFFRKQMKRRDFDTYIRERLAADFACALAAHLEQKEAEAQALREEVAQLKQFNVTLSEENTRLFADWEKADQEVAALRARVVVFPDFDNDVILETFKRNGFRIELGDTYSVKGQIAQLLNALGDLANLNGKSISAETLRRIDLVLAAIRSHDFHGIIASTIGDNWREEVDAMRCELRAIVPR